ncbi:hypothetical protein BHU25_22085 [Pseudomonas vranovensis]|uniref:Uncharacterized protein n=1 Tax=Pseudomonas vranovensis TaxID=321661 RepID=A0A423CYZ7_9PSED|nr:hypothetical protein BHU25_22085 [Pseudomonas vranovensis]
MVAEVRLLAVGHLVAEARESTLHADLWAIHGVWHQVPRGGRTLWRLGKTSFAGLVLHIHTAPVSAEGGVMILLPIAAPLYMAWMIWKGPRP